VADGSDAQTVKETVKFAWTVKYRGPGGCEKEISAKKSGEVLLCVVSNDSGDMGLSESKRCRIVQRLRGCFGAKP